MKEYLVIITIQYQINHFIQYLNVFNKLSLLNLIF
jgi:hypothetical protein